jgi:hypothetical protein
MGKIGPAQKLWKTLQILMEMRVYYDDEDSFIDFSLLSNITAWLHNKVPRRTQWELSIP